MGMIIAALGLFCIVYNDPKIQFGMALGIFFASLMVLLIPHVLVGACVIRSMNCRLSTIPALTVLSVFALLVSGIKITRNLKANLAG